MRKLTPREVQHSYKASKLQSQDWKRGNLVAESRLVKCSISLSVLGNTYQNTLFWSQWHINKNY